MTITAYRATRARGLPTAFRGRGGPAARKRSGAKRRRAAGCVVSRPGATFTQGGRGSRPARVCPGRRVGEVGPWIGHVQGGRAGWGELGRASSSSAGRQRGPRQARGLRSGGTPPPRRSGVAGREGGPAGRGAAGWARRRRRQGPGPGAGRKGPGREGRRRRGRRGGYCPRRRARRCGRERAGSGGSRARARARGAAA